MADKQQQAKQQPASNSSVTSAVANSENQCTSVSRDPKCSGATSDGTSAGTQAPCGHSLVEGPSYSVGRWLREQQRPGEEPWKPIETFKGS